MRGGIAAVNIFILIGSYLMLDRVPKLARMVELYIQMLFVTITGLVFVVICIPEYVSVRGIISCVFPFTGRAYEFISYYLLLMLLAPCMSKLVNVLEDKMLFALTNVIFFIVSVLGTFMSILSWKKSYFGVFICLFFVAACLKRIPKFKHEKIIGLSMYFLSAVLLICSYYTLEYLSRYIEAFVTRKEYFFSYTSPLVIMAAVGLFLVFRGINVRNQKVQRFAIFLGGQSLFTYIYHMHPIIKNTYDDLYLKLQLVSIDNNVIYMINILGIALLVYIVGMVLGGLLGKAFKKFGSVVTKKLLNIRVFKSCMDALGINADI